MNDNKKLLYGCAYYLEYMPYDRIETDMQMMKDAGMNVIRIGESTWSTWEPSEGVFDFTLFDRMLDMAEKYGMNVIVGTPSYAIPAWLSKKPGVMVETKYGKAPYGARQIYNIMSPALRFHIERIIRQEMEHCKGRDCVIGFQIDNETKHYGVMNEEVQDAFKKYLEKRYGSVEMLNKAFYLQYWSNSIASFDDLPDIKGSINAGLAGEYAAFQRSLVTDYLLWERSIVDEYRRDDQFVTHNTDFGWHKYKSPLAVHGSSWGPQPDCDHDKEAEALTIAGTDIYHMTESLLTGMETAYGGDEMRPLIPGEKNYLVLETEAQGFREWTPYPGQIRLQAYAHLASGASMVEYWHWHSIHNSFETYWKGILSHDLKPNAVYSEASIVGNEWKKLGYEHLVISKKNDTAIIVDNRSLTAFNWYPIDGLSYNDIVMWVYKALYDLNIECDVIFEDQIEEGKIKLSDYKTIVTPALYSVTRELTEKLREWVKEGGRLISTFKSFFADRNLSVWSDSAPYNLTDVFGVYYQQFVNPERLFIEGAECRYFAELLMTVEGSEPKKVCSYEHPYWNRYIGVSQNKFGKGEGVYIGSYCDGDMLKNIFKEVLKPTGPEWPVTVRSGVNAAGKNIHYILHFSENEGTFVNPYGKVKELISGEKYDNGAEIPLTDWDVKVLEEI